MHMTATAVAATYPFSTAVALDDPLTDNSRGNSYSTFYLNAETDSPF
jgi:hypothetical protein